MGGGLYAAPPRSCTFAPPWGHCQERVGVSPKGNPRATLERLWGGKHTLERLSLGEYQCIYPLVSLEYGPSPRMAPQMLGDR